MAQCPVSQDYLTLTLQTLKQNKPQSSLPKSPILQLLAFESNQSPPQSQPIIIRLSDSLAFLDCVLAGPFSIVDGRIVHNDCNGGGSGNGKGYRTFDVVRLRNFDVEFQERKICKLRVVVREMEVVERRGSCLGAPAQLMQHLDNLQSISCEDLQSSKPNSYQLEHLTKKSQNFSTDSTPIKIEDQHENQKQQKEHREHNNNEGSKGKYQGEEILTGKEILMGREGIFAGRLLRMKITNKDTKDGQLSVLILGFVDRVGEFVRVTMAGRIAIKEYRQLKKQKCYLLKGLQPYTTAKNPIPQIRIKQKQFKISQLPSSPTPSSPSSLSLPASLFPTSFHNWDHEPNFTESERVDVVGIVQEIEEAVLYGEEHVRREVVRIVVRNIVKCVRVSFWADQIGSFQGGGLRKKEAIVLEDIKRKKNKFLDFTYQSSIIHLDSDPALKSMLAYLLPQPQPQTPPTHISQLPAYITLLTQTPQTQPQPQTPPTIPLTCYLTTIHKKKLTYKLCPQCKRKVQAEGEVCRSCGWEQGQGEQSEQKKEEGKGKGKGGFQFKYNCEMEFSDWSGGLVTVVFDGPATGFFGRTAQEISAIKEQEFNSLVDGLMYEEFKICIESKNLRFILRSIQRQTNESSYLQRAKQNITQIKTHLKKQK